LSFVLCQAESDPKRATVTRAYDYLQRSTARHGTDKTIRTSTATLKRVWSKFGCVAHLWAAQMCLEPWLDLGPDPEFLPDLDKMFPLFLALSEKDRIRGEEFIPLRSKTPVLDASVMWRPPAKLTLPKIKLPAGPPVLPDEISRILSKYKYDDVRPNKRG
jgi:hypothetical protein